MIIITSARFWRTFYEIRTILDILYKSFAAALATAIATMPLPMSFELFCGTVGVGKQGPGAIEAQSDS